MLTKEITIASKAYTVAELPTRKNAEWRKRFNRRIEPAIMALGGKIPTSMADLESDPAVLPRFFALIQSSAGFILESVDGAIDLLFDYSPALAADRARIEEEAFDSELLEAFVAIVGLAFPFGIMLKKFQGAGIGSQTPLK